MASPQRIFGIYAYVHAHAREIADFQLAKGEPVSSTVRMLADPDRAHLLARWGEEMEELCGVLDGTHADSYLMEATQTFYWASLYAVTGGVSWAQLDFAGLRQRAARSGIDRVDEVRAQVARLVAMAPDQAKPSACFVLWNVADGIYRRITPPENQWSIEQLMEADYQEMRKRAYLEPVLRQVQA